MSSPTSRFLTALALASLLGCARQRPTPTAGAPTAAAPAAPAASLEETVRARLDSLRARTTMYALDLRTGREVAVRADEPMNTVSVIKTPVAAGC